MKPEAGAIYSAVPRLQMGPSPDPLRNCTPVVPPDSSMFLVDNLTKNADAYGKLEFFSEKVVQLGALGGAAGDRRPLAIGQHYSMRLDPDIANAQWTLTTYPNRGFSGTPLSPAIVVPLNVAAFDKTKGTSGPVFSYIGMDGNGNNIALVTYLIWGDVIHFVLVG